MEASASVGDGAPTAKALVDELRASLRGGATPAQLADLREWRRLSVVRERAVALAPAGVGVVVSDLLREAVGNLRPDEFATAARLILGLHEAGTLSARRRKAAAALGSTPESFRKHHEARVLLAVAESALEIDARETSYKVPRGASARRDVFLCHAHIDKARYARPLASALESRGVSCWLDEAQILPGDSLFRAINEGLSGAQCVVVLLTDAFVGRAWTERELEAATSVELESGGPVVIPVVATSRDDLVKRYPLLAGKFALSWDEGVDAIANVIERRFDRNPARDWIFLHPENYVGPIWTRLVPQSAQTGKHSVVLRWGPFVWRRRLDLRGRPLALAHHKERPDQVPLLVEVTPDAIVTAGLGMSPGEDILHIDEGWTRAAGWSFSIHDRAEKRARYERNAERARWLERLRQEYVLTSKTTSHDVLVGLALPPRDWLERRADELDISDLLAL